MLNRFLFVCVVASLLSCAPTLDAQTRAALDTRSLSLPAVGDCTLQILSPTLLEFTRISTKEKASAWTQLKVALGRRSEPSSPTAPEFLVTVDGQPAKVSDIGIRRRVLYAPLARRDLRVATHYFLRLAVPLEPQATAPLLKVSLPNDSPETPALSATARFEALRTNPAIHVNQEGYVPSLPKQAMIGYYLGDLGEMDLSEGVGKGRARPLGAPEDQAGVDGNPGRPSGPALPAGGFSDVLTEQSGFTLIDALTSEPVHYGALTARRDAGYKTSPRPYQHVLVADFSDFRTPGEYRLAVPGLGASLPFLIDDGIAMGFVRAYALGLYHQRCGTANALPFTRFVHDACHTAPAQIPSPQSDAQFTFTWATLGRTAAEASPDNPPQTAPLFTSEAASLYPFVHRGTVDVAGGHHDAGDYSKYTINSAELIHYLVFAVDSMPGVAAMDNLGLPESGDGISDVLQEAKIEADYLAKLQDADGGFYFLVYPKTREYESEALPDHGDAQVVWPKNTAATAAAVAALAQCASSPEFKKHFPAATAGYLKQAKLGWQFLTQAIAQHGKAGAYQKITFYGDHYTHDDELTWAACELFLATADNEYRQQLFTWFPNPADYATFRWGWWRMSECWGNAIRSYAFAARSGRLPASALDPRYLRICEGEIIAAGDDAAGWSRANAYATPFPLPTKAVRGAGWYFSLDQASDMAVAYQIEPKPAYLEALTGAMNYEAGNNPVNVTYLTGLGQHRQREIVHQYAQNDRRVLPPSGIPLGNLQTAFQHMPAYGFELREATYPDDNAAAGPFPFYDRWSDAFNVTTEFITVNQARSLLATVCLAHGTTAATQPWKPLPAAIVLPVTVAPLHAPVTLRLEVPGENLATARIVWEARDQEPAFGASYTISPRSNGAQWVEAEAAWPDGRRAFAAGTFAAGTFAADSANVAWIEAALPSDATPTASGGDGWNWIDTAPAPHSGARIHRSNLAVGLHEHGFTEASATLAIGAGDTLFAWVQLDPKNPPTEIMLTWNDGSSWEHRAYWGANTITYGRSGSASRFPAGPLPAAGRWIRLSVAARAVGLEGATVNGMGFSLVDGQATWGRAGRTAAGHPR